MNTRDLDFFIKVYETKSINLAAEKLYISPQGLSTVIRKLEKELGCTLFNRDRGGSVPTESGDIWYKYALSIKRDYENALSELGRINRLDRGNIKFGFSFGAMSGLSMDFPLRFEQMHPDFKLEYMELPDAAIERFVESGELDLGFAAYVDRDRFDATFVWESKILFVPRRKSRFYERESVSVSEIADEPITMRNSDFATTRILSEEFEKAGKKPEVILNTGGIMRSVKLCRDNMANTVIIDSVAEQFGKDEIRTIPFKEDLGWPLYMILKKGETPAAAVSMFAEYMIDKMKR